VNTAKSTHEEGWQRRQKSVIYPH